MIVQRGFRAPPSYHEERLRNAPVGYFFDVMTNGFGAMQDYSAQVTVTDRWAIAAYIRALQLSRHATVDDVPADRRGDLDQPADAPGATRTGEPATVNTTYAPPAADIDVPRSRALIVAGIGLVGCAIGFFVECRAVLSLVADRVSAVPGHHARFDGAGDDSAPVGRRLGCLPPNLRGVEPDAPAADRAVHPGADRHDLAVPVDERRCSCRATRSSVTRRRI